MTRKKIVAGNWKMNLQLNDAIQLIDDIGSNSKDLSGVELMVFPPALFLLEIAKIKNELTVGVQNFYPKETSDMINTPTDVGKPRKSFGNVSELFTTEQTNGTNIKLREPTRDNYSGTPVPFPNATARRPK